jgi:hypothetical protein
VYEHVVGESKVSEYQLKYFIAVTFKNERSLESPEFLCETNGLKKFIAGHPLLTLASNRNPLSAELLSILIGKGLNITQELEVFMPVERALKAGNIEVAKILIEHDARLVTDQMLPF